METAVVSATRDAAGRFQPGASGNPGGRAGLPAEVRRKLEAAVPEAVDRLIELMRSDDDRVAMAAVAALLDRLYGKPALAVEKTVTTTNVQAAHLRVLQEIQARKQEIIQRAANATDVPVVNAGDA